jgi:hypothetical protein
MFAARAAPDPEQVLARALAGTPGLLARNMLSSVDDMTDTPAATLIAWFLLRSVIMGSFSWPASHGLIGRPVLTCRLKCLITPFMHSPLLLSDT